MTVHFILPGYAPDAVGGYRVVYDYAIAIARSGKESVVVHHSPWPLLRHPGTLTFRAIAGLGYRVIRSWIDRPAARGVPWYSETTAIDMRFTPFRPRMTPGPSDVVVATSAHTAPFAAISRGEAAAVYFIQHVERWSASESFISSTWKLPLHRIVIAPWLQEYGTSLGVDSNLVPNAIDGSLFVKGPRLVDRPRRVMAMTSPLSFKRADLVAEVFKQLHQVDQSIDLVAFGAHARPSELPDYVRYVQSPSREELARLYASSRVYFCASDAEGWHLPPAEALMSGTAVASTDIGGVRVVAGEDAEYVPPGDGSALAGSVLRLLADADLAQRMVDRGESRLRGYTPEAAAEAFYDQLCSARDRRK